MWVNHQVLPWSNLPITLDTRWGRVGSERRLDRLIRFLFLFNEQDEGSLFPVPVETGGDITLVVDVGLRVLDVKMLMLVPLLLPPLEDSVAIGPPGKV